MGAGDIESLAQQNAELAATKPRERQFQVVPMPGVFTRGRWKCWDYYPESKEESQTDKKEKDVAAEKEKSEVTTTVVVPETVPVTTSPVDIPSDNNMVDGGANKENTPAIAEAVTTAETTPVKGDRESSTILVTSVAPAPATPQHGTPQSISGSLEHYVDSPLNTVASAQSDVTLASGSTKPVMSNAVEENNAQQQQLTGRTTPVPQQPLNPAAPSQSTTGGAQPNSTLRQISGTESTPTDEEADGSSGNGISKAAIDNKIEQAMDLVKTHLTFAVREEVETLRVTIAELELKVASLESENQLLRQYAPVEVVSQLPSLVQQQKSTTAPPQPSAATLPLSPPKVPAGFCSSTFATTLNNVVGDVRQEMAMAAQNNTQQQEQEGGN